MALTIKDVAALAKVSKGTVSKVLNDGQGVSAKTRARILKLIEDLDYQPNAAAQVLASRRTSNIGVIIPHTGNYSMASAYWPLLLTAITEQAAAVNFNVLLSTARSEEDVDSAYKSILRGRRVDGLIVGAEQFGQKQLAELLIKGFPFVMVGRSQFVSHYHVDADNTGGARALAQRAGSDAGVPQHDVGGGSRAAGPALLLPRRAGGGDGAYQAGALRPAALQRAVRGGR